MKLKFHVIQKSKKLKKNLKTWFFNKNVFFDNLKLWKKIFSKTLILFQDKFNDKKNAINIKLNKIVWLNLTRNIEYLDFSIGNYDDVPGCSQYYHVNVDKI